MSTKKSGIWSIALPLSVVFLAAAYYVKMPDVRKAVDARTPVVRNLLGRFVQESGVRTIVMQGELDPAFAKPKPSKDSASVKPVEKTSLPIPPPAVPAAPPARVVEAAPPPVAAAPLDLKAITGDRTKWPKKVALTKAATFPAVLNGKIVGSLIAPAGAEATLITIKDEQVGLEFNGGGAWLPVDQTDLVARAQTPR